ncbi:MAG: discoidin domain-containing protein, partial [Thermoflexales bacterium]|nr:discoidin domain-containing protein [Thermoflexales bacterium]
LEAKPWWQVDLGAVISLTQIVLWNRTDCCSDRLSNFRVFVSTDPFTSTDPVQTQAQPGVWTYSNAGAVGATLPISTLQNSMPITGRYVRVQLLGTNYLHLREVQVFGSPRPIGTCSGTACPTVGGTGYVGQAAQFDGSDDAVSLPANLLSANSFSFVGWVKWSGNSNGQRIFDLGSSSTEYLYLSPRSSNGRVRFEIRSASGSAQYLESPAALPTNTWTPVAVTLDGASDLARIYLNGAEVVSGTISVDPNQIAQTSNWLGKSRFADPYFNGLLDEAAFYNRMLTTDEIQRLAQTTVAGVQGVEAAFTQLASGFLVEPTRDDQAVYLPLDDYPDQYGAVGFKNLAGTATTTCAGTTCPTTGAVGMRGAAAQFDGVDDRVVISSSQVITGNFTVAAWVKLNNVNASLSVMGSREPGDYSFDFKFQNGNQIHGDIGTGTAWLTINADANYTYQVGTWYHVAYAVTPTGYAIYMNGAQIGQGTFSGVPLLTDANHALRLGSYGASGEQFDGLIDEVRVFRRALSETEVRALYRGVDPVLKLDFENNFADSSSWTQAVGAPTAAQTPQLLPGTGIVGQMAAQFDGVDDRLTLTPAITLANQSFSVMFWAKQTRFDVYQFALGAGSAANNQGLQIGFTNQNKFECGFYANDLMTSAAYPDSNWHQWTCTFDAGTKKRTIYRDGTQVAQDTASANYQGGNNWVIGNAAWGNSPFQGQLDEVRVYPVALPADEVNALAQTGFRSATVTSTGAGVTASTWTLTPPAGLEGLYRLDVRGKDANGLVDLTNLGNNQWTGAVDTLAPRILYSAKSNQFGTSTYHIFTVRDFNLNTDNIRMSVICNNTGSTRPQFVGAPGWPAPRYTNPVWYRLGGGQPMLSEQTLVCVQTGLDQPGAMLTVCDTAGNCTQQNSANPAPSVAADVDVASAMVQYLTANDRSTLARAAGGPGANIAIQTPIADTVLSTIDPISITGSASSYLSLKAITVTVDGTPVYTTSYLAHAITSTNFAVDWTPMTEGAHVLQAEAADWGPDALYTIYLPIMLQTGSIGLTNAAETQSALPIKPQVLSTSEPITIYLDLTPPSVDLGSTVFTRTAYAPPSVRFSGSVTDALGLDHVIVEVGDSALTANTDQADQWTADWPVDASALPDGVTYPITATAIDRAGHLTTSVITGVIDVVGPNVQPSITIDDQPLVAGLWITQTEPHTYTLTLPPAVDGSGTLGYWFGYTLGPAFTLDMLEFAPYESDVITLTRAITLPNDGQALYLHVVAYDMVGNDTTQTFGPVYVDTPVAPDYIGMNEPTGPYQGLPYRQWMDNSCSYLGQDLRVPMRAQPGAALAEAQKLYATWDRSAMRITWSGADWNRDGDLFVYFDTIPDQMPDYPGTIPYVRHGSHVAYDPYAATMNSTLMLLPVQEWSSIPVFFPDLWPDLNRMNADYAVWVENDTTLHLLQWDDGSQQWTEIALPDTAAFNFSTDTGTPLTEFYLPLDAVSATIGSQVNLVAFASDDDALRVWSVLPSTNPASSRKVMVNAVPANEPFQFMLTDCYTFTLD